VGLRGTSTSYLQVTTELSDRVMYQGLSQLSVNYQLTFGWRQVSTVCGRLTKFTGF
jgi:hypothetical protein